MDAKVVVFGAIAAVVFGFVGFIYLTSSMTNIPMFSYEGKDEL